MNFGNPILPDGIVADGIETQLIYDVWNAILSGDDPGGASWEFIENANEKVMSLLSMGDPASMREASQMTAIVLSRWKTK